METCAPGWARLSGEQKDFPGGDASRLAKLPAWPLLLQWQSFVFAAAHPGGATAVDPSL